MGQISSIYGNPMFAAKKKGENWRTKYIKKKKSISVESRRKTAKRTYRMPDGGYGKDFYRSREWLEIRYLALTKHGGKCMCCGSTRKDGIKLHVDHIKPRSKYPELELSLNNLQVLCESCNVGKSNKREDDFRRDENK